MHKLFFTMVTMSKINSLQTVSDWSVVLICAHTLFLSEMFKIRKFRIRNIMTTGDVLPNPPNTYRAILL